MNSPRSRNPTALYLFSFFWSAFLYFQIELILGKFVLPFFGGGPSVWSACLLTFQLLLLAGYGYALALSAKLDFRKQALTHLSLLVLSVALLALVTAVRQPPVVPAERWRPQAGIGPVWQIGLLLIETVGLPCVLLSATTPLLQHWFGESAGSEGTLRLYSMSNAGSLLGLVTYPFLLERWLPLRVHAWLWTGGYLGFAMACGWLAYKAKGLPASSAASPAGGTRKPALGRMVTWGALAACGSAMLLASTNLMCQDVAVVPLLWVAPLSVYLLSFILCFHHPRWYRREVFHPLYAALTLLSLWTLAHARSFAVAGQIALYCLTLFTVCMICHGELALAKPASRNMPWFYLAIGLGGAAGSAFVALAAPLLFERFWEYQLALIACGCLLSVRVWRDKRSWFYGSRARWIGVAALLAVLAGGYALTRDLLGNEAEQLVAGRTRNFFGVKTILRDRQGIWLKNGQTVHGMQYQDPFQRDIPTLYYQPRSGIGLLLRYYPRAGHADGTTANLRVGVVGLGAGTLASYAHPGDYFRFYEIDPAVFGFSLGAKPVFTFLQDSRAQIDIVIGDARVAFEEEAAKRNLQKFDILCLDAFSSDAVPVHLLTAEAMALYLAELRGPDSVIAFHLTNRALDLRPVVRALAHRYHLESVEVSRAGAGDWVLASANGAILRTPGIADHAHAVTGGEDVLWSDEFSNLFQVLKR